MVAQWLANPSGAETGVKKDASTKLSKQITWLNDKAGLKAHIRFNEVRELLDNLGDAAAMKVLKEVEEKGASLHDPTLYVKSAATAQLKRLGLVGATPQAGSPHGGYAGALVPLSRSGSNSQTQQARHMGPAEQQGGMRTDELYTDLWNRTNSINNRGSLKKILDLDRVYELLAALGHAGAHQILTRLEQNAGSVNDPTGWVITAARKEQPNHRLQQQQNGYAGSSGTAGAHSDPTYDPSCGAGDNWGVMYSPSGQQNGLTGSEPLEDRLRNQISWLNSSVALAAPLESDRVLVALMSIGDFDAMRVLKTLENKADSVRDPTGWVFVATGKVRQEQQARPQTMPQAMPQAMPSMQSSSFSDDDKLKKRIGWLNKHGSLAAPLSYDRLSQTLYGLGSTDVMEILKSLEASAAMINDPTAYVEATAKRRKLNRTDGATPSYSSISRPGAVVPVRGVTVPMASSMVNSEATDKFKRKVAWMNHNANLQEQLTWDEVSVYLLQIDADRGMNILKGLQDSAATVRNPNNYVITAARKALQESPSGTSELDTKIRRRIGWLNCNVQFSQPLMYNKVIGDLIPLGIPQAMVLLKEVEEHALDPDPSLWIIQKAREIRGGAPPAVTPEERISKRIAWLNDKVHFSTPVELATVMPSLLGLDIRQAMQLLKRLEENAETITDPTSYVQAEASKEPQSTSLSTDRSDSGEAWDRSDSGEACEAFDTSNFSPEDALWYSVERLNGSRLLLAPLSYEQISPALLATDREQASHILKSLEKDAPYVEDPNAFVIAEAQLHLASAYDA